MGTDPQPVTTPAAVAPVALRQGWKTTEFYVALVPMLLGIALLFGWIDPANIERAQPAIPLIAGGLAVAIPSAAYAISRGLAKLGWFK